AAGAKSNRSAVGRPEGTVRALGTSNLAGISGIERPDPQPGLTLGHGDECRGPAIRRNRKASAQIAASGNVPSFGRSDLEANDLIVFERLTEMGYGPAAKRTQYQRRCRGCNPSWAVRFRSNRLFERPAEGALQIERGLESLLRILRQASPDNPLHRRSDVKRR